jgi:FkbM family methyltransferase
VSYYHSQYGEDQWLVRNLSVPAHGVFVDVGAGDGMAGSNTLFFEERGWDGLCIDADPRNSMPLSKRRKNAIWGVVSTKETVQTLTCAQDVQLTGLNPPSPRLEGVRIQVPTIRLDGVLDQFGIHDIDLLSIDTEGTELDILESFSFETYHPHLVIVEYRTCQNDHSAVLLDFFAQLGCYEWIHQTSANMIWSDGHYPRRRRHYKSIEIGVSAMETDTSDQSDHWRCIVDDVASSLHDVLRNRAVQSMDVLKIAAENQEQRILDEYGLLVREHPEWKAQTIEWIRREADSPEERKARENALRDMGYLIFDSEEKRVAKMPVPSQPRIKVIQYMYGDKEYFGWSRRINGCYCERHGYDYQVLDDVPRSDRHICWHKIPVILKELHDCEYLLFLDADAVFYSHELTLEEELLPLLVHTSVLMAQDCGNESLRWTPGYPNSGAILVKNDGVARQFLTDWNRSSELDADARWNWPLEQLALWHLVLPDYQKEFRTLRDYYRMQGQYGQFIRHFCLCNDQFRVEQMKTIARRLKSLVSKEKCTWK